MAGIGTLRETSLHAGLKAWYAQPGDEAECLLDGYVVDLRRGQGVIEIQTGHFSQIRRKLDSLLERRPVRLVYPVAVERWIVRVGPDRRTPLSRRKSPRRGSITEVFTELVSFPELLAHPNFSLEVAMIREEEWRRPWARRPRGWRRQWRVVDRRLVEVIGVVPLEGPGGCRALLPADLPRPFTNRDLAGRLHQPAYLAEKMTYCLRRMGALAAVGRRGRAMLHDFC